MGTTPTQRSVTVTITVIAKLEVAFGKGFSLGPRGNDGPAWSSCEKFKGLAGT